MLISIFVTLNVAYFLCSYNVTKVGGDTFVMGAMIGLGEASAGFFSGIIIVRFNENVAYNLFVSIASSCTLLLYYAKDFLLRGSGIGGVIVLYMAMVGVGGAYNSSFIIIKS